jgi:hypothetical protein
LKDRIAQAVQQAQVRLAAATEAAEILDRNPDLERLINLLNNF